METVQSRRTAMPAQSRDHMARATLRSCVEGARLVPPCGTARLYHRLWKERCYGRVLEERRFACCGRSDTCAPMWKSGALAPRYRHSSIGALAPEGITPGTATGFPASDRLELTKGIDHTARRYPSNTVKTAAYSSGLVKSFFTSHT